MKLLDDIIARVDAIDRNEHYCVNSCSILFEEFLKRLTYVYDNSKTDAPFTLSFYLPTITDIEETHELVKNSIKSGYYSRFGNGGYLLIHNWIYWELNKKSLRFYTSISSVDLYEPIVRLLERGGRIDREHGFYQVCNRSTLSIKKIYTTSSFLLDMSDEYLDSIDKDFDVKSGL